jgi:cytidylate kinase
MDSGPIITIARQNGSGGREIAEILAGKLGIRSYDRALISETARLSGLTEEQVYEREERGRKGGMTFYGFSAANPLYELQSEAIRRLAGEDGSCVFVGRCADYVLSGRPDLITVFVHASEEECARRSAGRNGISEGEARRRVAERNRERALYYHRYTGRVWGDAANYDLCVDTTRISLGQAADLIISYSRMRGF